MGAAFDREAGHVSGHHGAFVARWLRLLALEETGLTEKRSEIWRLHGVLSALASSSARHWLFVWRSRQRCVHHIGAEVNILHVPAN